MKNGNQMLHVYSAVIILLVGVTGYLLKMDFDSNQKSMDELKTSIKSVEKELHSLKTSQSVVIENHDVRLTIIERRLDKTDG